MEKSLIYSRVSSEEQIQGFSLDGQEKFCRKFAEDNGYQVVKVYRDEGKSGTNLNRPALQDLLAQCQQDKSINAVIVQETDRLARNTQDHLAIRAILKKLNVKLISVAQPMLDDSPEGNMIDTILASVNQFQSDINSRKTKKGLQEKFNSGWWPGWSPLGYLNKKNNDKTIVTKDPERWDLIKEGLKMYLTGNYSAIEIADILYEKGLKSKEGKKVCNSIMINILRNPFYAGTMRWNNQEKVGNHEPMIAPEEHQQILTIMDAHNQHACRRRKHNFLLRGFVFCDICNQRYTAEKHRIGRNPDYYHCSARSRQHSNVGQNIETEELEKQVEEQFKSIQLSEGFINLVVQKVKDFYQNQEKEKSRKKRVLSNKKIKIERDRTIAEKKLIKGVLSDDDFVRLRDQFKENINIIQCQINELENKREADIDTVREILMLARNIFKAYQKASYEIKRLYLGFFWDGFWIKDRKIVRSEPTKLIKALQNKGKIILKPSWLAWRDSFRTFEWEKACPAPEMIINQVSQLLALV